MNRPYLYNEGTTRDYTQKELNKIFNTKGDDSTKGEEYLAGAPINVIRRQFNWLPGMRSDPPRSASEPIPPAMNTNEKTVMNTNPQTNTAHDISRLWMDGTYSDAVAAINKGNLQNFANINFRAPVDLELRIDRMEREQALSQGLLAVYKEKEIDKYAEQKIILEEAGYTPEVIDKAIEKKLLDDAEKLLKLGKTHTAMEAQRRKEMIDNIRLSMEGVRHEQMSAVGEKALETTPGRPTPGRGHLWSLQAETAPVPSKGDVMPGQGAPVLEPDAIYSAIRRGRSEDPSFIKHKRTESQKRRDEEANAEPAPLPLTRRRGRKPAAM
jgi:hypothetical protein